MIELERHIEILLLTNDCVIVPDLGGFMAHHVDAHYDETDGMFLPPQRTLGFNPQLTMNDSLLVQSYIEAYDISYPEALRRIESEVAELRQHLENDGQYELNDIGLLRLNEEGHFEFEPCEAGLLTPALYGLCSFEMQPLYQISENRKANVVTLKNGAAEREDLREGAKTEDSKPGKKADKAKTKANRHDNDTIVIKMSWIRNAVAVAAAIVAFFMIQVPVSNSSLPTEVQQSTILPISVKEAHTAKVVKAETASAPVEKPAVAEQKTEAPRKEMKEEVKETNEANKATAKETVKERVADTKADVKADTKVEAKADKKAAVQAPVFCIVLASQTTRALADEFVAQQKKAGNQSVRTINMRNSNKVRVVYGSYSSESEAHNQLRKLRTKEIFQDAWVLQL